MKKTTDLLKRAEILKKRIGSLKLLYSEMDEINQTLAKRNFSSRKIGRTKFQLIDLYMGKTTNFKTVAFPRYELQIDRL